MRTFKVTVNGNQYDVTVEELGAPAASSSTVTSN